MKKILMIICISVIASASGINAQNTDPEIGLIKSMLKSEIKVFFAQNIKLKTSETETFWNIYDEYEAAMKPLSSQRIDLITNIIDKKGVLSEEELDKKIMALNKSLKARQALRMKYYKKFKKQLGIGIASQFYQIDGYIYTHINATMNESLPIIIPGKN